MPSYISTGAFLLPGENQSTYQEERDMSHEHEQHEDIRAKARESGAWEISSDESATIIAGDSRTQDENTYVVRPTTVGVLAMGKSALPGADLEDGPIFGNWPGVAFLGETRDPEGNVVNSKIAGSPGIMVMMEQPDMIVQSVYNLLSILLTEPQAKMIIDMVEGLAGENMDKHVPPMLVERAMKTNGITMDDVDKPLPKRTAGIADISHASGIAGLLEVAKHSDLPAEQVEILGQILNDESLSAQEKFEKASDFLVGHGVLLINMSGADVSKKLSMLEQLKASHNLHDVSDDGKAFTASMSAEELLQILPDEQATQMMLKVLDAIENGLGDQDDPKGD